MSNIILCADDSKTMQTVAEITFRVSDFQYVGAKSADEALEKAREQKPTLILADAVMPDKTGYDLCKMIKDDPNLSDVPVIMLCGNSEAYDESKGSAAGADGHLPKPWDSQVMLDKVTELVERHKSAGGATASSTATPPSSQPDIGKIKAPRLSPAKLAANAPNVPSPGSKDAGAARTHTIMGMPSIQPPGPAPVKPAAPPPVTKPATPNPLASPPRLQTAPPKPATLKPAVPPKPTIPQPPKTGRRPTTVLSKYAPPAMKSAITKPGVPDPPKPAQAAPEADPRPTKAMPAALKPAAPPKPTIPTPPTVTPAAKPVPTPPPTLAPTPLTPTAKPTPTPPPTFAPTPLTPTTTPASAESATPADKPARTPARPEPVRPSTPAPTATPTAAQPLGRPPMIRGIPTKQPAFIAPAALRQVDLDGVTRAAVARVAADVGIAADGPEVKALLALSHDVVERLIWEIVPDLAEAIIRENLDTLTAKR